jgi:hypothetical protein
MKLRARVRWSSAVAAVTTVLLVACPVRNLLSVRACLAVPGVVMDIPPKELHLEATLLLLQSILAILGGLALCLGTRDGRTARAAAAASWILVAVGGFTWDKLLGNFVGEALPSTSALGCLLGQRSAHTHTMLTNTPLMASVGLALWLVRDVVSARPRTPAG